ncbi:hypothetical protein C8R48DRAFT_266903 [Suillus tomentosus]|nr:hypothetical protein C8R48DRAFT_266903 [Suillus tomentosus]
MPRRAQFQRAKEDDDDNVDMEEGEDERLALSLCICHAIHSAYSTSTLRANALLLTGTPIFHLPIARIFGCVIHFDTYPMGLEWLDDDG